MGEVEEKLANIDDTSTILTMVSNLVGQAKEELLEVIATRGKE